LLFQKLKYLVGKMLNLNLLKNLPYLISFSWWGFYTPPIVLIR